MLNFDALGAILDQNYLLPFDEIVVVLGQEEPIIFGILFRQINRVLTALLEKDRTNARRRMQQFNLKSTAYTADHNRAPDRHLTIGKQRFHWEELMSLYVDFCNQLNELTIQIQ